jgi:octaprenyl-diphosphate synthase
MDPQYNQRLKKIEAVLGEALPEIPHTSWTVRSFAAPLPVSGELIRSLTAPGRDLLNRGGKRWRPLLMTLSCEALGGGDGALPLVPLVELSHNASLIHDDIEDNSDTRRGKPAIHLLYGTDTAINGGAFLYFLSPACIAPWDPRPSKGSPAALEKRKNRIHGAWGEHMRRLHLGQAMDIHWHRDFSSLPALEEYHTMCRLKTGCLPRLAAILGVYAADTALFAEKDGDITQDGEALGEILGEAAEKLGVGFQILDDVKNLTTGNPGKKRGDDIVEGKKSLPVLLYLHRRKDRRAFAARCFSAAREKGPGAGAVEELIGELDAGGVLEEARNTGDSLIGEARKTFEGVPFRGFPGNRTGRDLLTALTGLIS